MKTINLFFNFIKKNIRTSKIRNTAIIILNSLFYLLIFVLLISTFSFKKTFKSTYESNLNNKEIGIQYWSPMDYLSSNSYMEYKEYFDEIDANVTSIYTLTNGCYFYDFDYLNIELINGSMDLNKLNYVYLSNDYIDEYMIGDNYNIGGVTDFIVGGFFIGEETVIANLNYAFSIRNFSFNNITFIVKYENITLDDIYNLIDIYDKLNGLCNEFSSFVSNELSVIKKMDKLSNIYIIICVVLIVCFSLFSIITILNVSSINEKIDGQFYSIMRINGVTKKRLSRLICAKDILINIISFILSIILFYIFINLVEDVLADLIYIIIDLFVDEFTFVIDYKFYDNVLIFIIPLILNIVIILINTILNNVFKKNFDYLGGLKDYAR